MANELRKDTILCKINMEKINNQIKFTSKLEKNKFLGEGNSSQIGARRT